MRISGVDPSTLDSLCYLVLPRSNGSIVFKAAGLKDMDEFTALCPQPKPPGKRTPQGFVPDEDDPTYQQVMAEWSKRRFAYMAIRSLQEIEWDTVNISDPRTWNNWQADLTKAGLTQIECNRVTALVMEANSLDEDKLKKARESFLAGQAAQPLESSGQTDARPSMPSGEPVSV